MAQLEATENLHAFSRQRNNGSSFEATCKTFRKQRRNGSKRTAFSSINHNKDDLASENVEKGKSCRHGVAESLPFSLEGWKMEDESVCLGKYFGRYFKNARRQDNVDSPASYDYIQSPEFKPGRFYILSRPMTNYNYRAARIDRCVTSYTYIRPNGQLCKNDSRRKIFCEVLGDKVCLDCNGRNVRRDFSTKMETNFPQLDYEPSKRPYGYCPRAVRLTDPLPTRQQLAGHPFVARTVASAPRLLNVKNSSSISLSGNCKQVGKAEGEEVIKLVTQSRPETR